jgi:hypothetical protein
MEVGGERIASKDVYTQALRWGGEAGLERGSSTKEVVKDKY